MMGLSLKPLILNLNLVLPVLLIPVAIASQPQKEEGLPADGMICLKSVTIYSMPDWLPKEP